MKLYIGENIKRLRKEKGFTQEEIAAHLGISFQSVSKWERDEGYPDITILPALSSYFGVSIDDLLGVNEIEKKKQYDKINALWAENNSNKRNKENVDLMRDSLKSFPNDPLLLVQLASSLEKLDGTPSERKKYLQQSIVVQEQILRCAQDCEVRGATMYNICFSYLKNGKKDKALEQAKKLPNLYKARENALVALLEGEEKYNIALSSLEPIAWVVSHQLSAIAETRNDPAYYEKALQILDILFEENNDFVDMIKSKLKSKCSDAGDIKKGAVKKQYH